MSEAPRQPPPKKDVALAFLEESSMFIHLDPRRPDVSVPRSYMVQPQLILQVGLNMAIAIPDLIVDDFGITCTLSFNRSPFWCKIPWTAVYALISEDGRAGVWPDDVPPEIQVQKAPKQPPAKRQRPRLAAVGDAAEPTTEPAPEPRRDAAKEPRRIGRLGPRPAPAPVEESPAIDEPAAPVPAARPAAGAKKKREIPPYLRVIK